MKAQRRIDKENHTSEYQGARDETPLIWRQVFLEEKCGLNSAGPDFQRYMSSPAELFGGGVDGFVAQAYEKSVPYNA